MPIIKKLKRRIVNFKCHVCGNKAIVFYMGKNPVSTSLKARTTEGWTINLTRPKKSLCSNCNLFK